MSLLNWIVKKSNEATERYHLNRILAEIRTEINSLGSGDVVGPASSVNNRVVFFDGITGKLIKDSGLTLSGTNTGDQDLSSYATTAAVAAGYQPLDSDLTAIAGLSPSNDDIIQRKAGAWTNRTIAQLKTDLSLSGTNTGDQTASGVSITDAGGYFTGTDVEAALQELGAGGGGGGGSGDAIGNSVTQAAHGLSVGMPINKASAGWVAADADSGTTMSDAVVSVVTDANTFTLVQAGKLTLTTAEWDARTGQTGGLTAGEYYWLSTTAGGLTTTQPTTGYAQCIGKAESTTVMRVHIGPTVALSGGTGSGLVRGSKIVEDNTAVNSGGVLIPLDSTPPLNTEGAEYTQIALTYTPSASDSILEVEFFCPEYTLNTAANGTVTMWQDSQTTPLAVANVTPGTSNYSNVALLRRRLTAGSTSARTFKVRYGANGSSMYLNQRADGNNYGGGLIYSHMKVTEYAP